MSFKKGDRVYHEHANEGSSGTVTRIEEGYIFVELDMKIHNYRQFVTKFSEDLTLLDEEHIFPVGSSVMTECGLFMGEVTHVKRVDGRSVVTAKDENDGKVLTMPAYKFVDRLELRDVSQAFINTVG